MIQNPEALGDEGGRELEVRKDAPTRTRFKKKGYLCRTDRTAFIRILKPSKVSYFSPPLMRAQTFHRDACAFYQ